MCVWSQLGQQLHYITWLGGFYQRADRHRSLQGNVWHPADDFGSWGDAGRHGKLRRQGVGPVAVLPVAGQRASIWRKCWLRVSRREVQPLNLDGRRGQTLTVQPEISSWNKACDGYKPECPVGSIYCSGSRWCGGTPQPASPLTARQREALKTKSTVLKTNRWCFLFL